MSEAIEEARLVDLERQVAETQKTLDELNDLTRRLWEDVDLLKAELKAIGRRVLEQAGGDAEGPVSISRG